MSQVALWEQLFSTRGWGAYPSEELIRFCAQRFYGRSPRSEVQVMEVGFGTGANLWYFAREGFSVHGLEGTYAGAAQARRRLDAELPGWDGGQPDRLRVGDMCEPLPWPDDRFDAVIDTDAVVCVDHPRASRVHPAMPRVPRPGGWLFARTPPAGTWGDGTGAPGGHHAWHCTEGPFAGTGAVRFATEDDLRELFRPWADVQVEQVSRTLEGRRRLHTEWVVIARKREAP